MWPFKGHLTGPSDVKESILFMPLRRVSILVLSAVSFASVEIAHSPSAASYVALMAGQRAR